MKKAILFSICAALLGIIITAAVAQEPPAPPVPLGPPPLPFEGKIIVVYTKTGGVMQPQCLSDWGKARIGEQDFISGKLQAYYDGMPAAGRKTWIAVSDIYQMVEYNEVDEFKQDVGRAWQMMRNWGGRGGNRNDGGAQPKAPGGDQKGGDIF